MVKIAFLSHGHPMFSKGGTEVASYSLFDRMRNDGHDCLYVARSGKKHHSGTTLSAVSQDEMLFHSPLIEDPNQSFTIGDHLKDLVSLFKKFKPDIIHVHHYLHIGIELFPILKNACPEAKIVFTMHEYLAICAHHGQMVKTETLELCHGASSMACAGCHPRQSTEAFFLRKKYYLNNLSVVDQFISPSQFLATRYIEWGLDKSRVVSIENVLDLPKSQPPRKLEGKHRGNFVFMGKASRFKGLDLLVNAVRGLPQSIKDEIKVKVYANKLGGLLGSEWKKTVSESRGYLDFMGAYDRENLPSILGESDWLIIPSIWWENSPVVIQEAAAVGRPIIASGIGGMKEKVEGKLGITFEANNERALQEAIIQAMDPACFDKWQAKLTISDSYSEHMALFKNLLKNKTMGIHSPENNESKLVTN